jgi:hypothetical protein
MPIMKKTEGLIAAAFTPFQNDGKLNIEMIHTLVEKLVIDGLAGMFDANNMPILCQFVSSGYRATAYGLMNMAGVFAGAFITILLGKLTDQGNLGIGIAMLSVIVLVALVIQLLFLRPRMNDFADVLTEQTKR